MSSRHLFLCVKKFRVRIVERFVGDDKDECGAILGESTLSLVSLLKQGEMSHVLFVGRKALKQFKQTRCEIVGSLPTIDASEKRLCLFHTTDFKTRPSIQQTNWKEIVGDPPAPWFSPYPHRVYLTDKKKHIGPVGTPNKKT